MAQSDDDWLTTEEAGKELGVQGQTIRYYIRRGQLKASPWGNRQWRIKRGDLKKIKTLDFGRPPRHLELLNK